MKRLSVLLGHIGGDGLVDTVDARPSNANADVRLARFTPPG